MVNYQNGKIYKLVGGNKTYYGSTCEKHLKTRLAQHKYERKRTDILYKCSSQQVLDEPDCDIYLVEAYPCNNKDELRAREGYYIHNFECVNKNIAGRSKQEYYKTHKVQIIANVNKWREENKAHCKARNAKKYLENKEAIKAKRSEQFVCECGKTYTAHHKARHQKTKYHTNYINSLSDNT